jgi:hypothetical protein
MSQLSQGRAGSQQQINTRTDASLYPTVANSGLNLRSKSNVFLARHFNVVQFNSSNLPTSSLLSGGFCDIRLIQSDCVANMAIQFVISNLDAKNPTAVMSYATVVSWLDHVDIICGSSVIQRVDSDHVLRDIDNNTPDARKRIIRGLQGGFDVPFVIAPGGSMTFYYPLSNNFVTSEHIPSAGLQAPITIRCWFRQVGQWATGLTAPPDLAIESFSIIAQTIRYEPTRHQQILTRYQSGPRQDLRFASTQFQRSTENLVAGNRFVLRLNSLNGMITSMHLLVRALGASITTALQIRSLDLLNSSGASILGSYQVDDLYRESVYMATQSAVVPADGQPTAYMYQVPFSAPYVDHSEMQGQVSGFVVMSGAHQLAFTPDNTGNFEITVLFNTVAVASVERGVISLQQS